MLSSKISKLKASHLRLSYTFSKFSRLLRVSTKLTSEEFSKILKDLRDSLNEVTTDYRTIVRDINEVYSTFVEFNKKLDKVDDSLSGDLLKFIRFIYNKSIDSPYRTAKLIGQGELFSNLVDSMNNDISKFIEIYQKEGFSNYQPSDVNLSDFLEDLLKGSNSQPYKANRKNILNIKSNVISKLKPKVKDLLDRFKSIKDPRSGIYADIMSQGLFKSNSSQFKDSLTEKSYNTILRELEDFYKGLNSKRIQLDPEETLDLDDFKYKIAF